MTDPGTVGTSEPSDARGTRQPNESGETTELARRYADALIGAAEKAGGVEAVLDELAEIEHDVLDCLSPSLPSFWLRHAFRRPTRIEF